MGNIKVGRIDYLNVLPIYHPLEQKIIDNDVEFVYGPPAQLNKMMSEGMLDIASTSSIEYLRHADQYKLLPDLAIGSRGPVQSVIVLSKQPIAKLNKPNILVSAQTHTSAALLKVLLTEYIPINPSYYSGKATEILESGERPEAILAIGDEALNLRKHKDYPYIFDLGEEWMKWTGKPFIFGVWVIKKELAENKEAIKVVKSLIEGKKWGQKNINLMSQLSAKETTMNEEQMKSYFAGLVWDLEKNEIEALKVFAECLFRNKLIPLLPELDFLEI